MLRLLFLIVIVIGDINPVTASYGYRLVEKDNHKIHIVTIKPTTYDMAIVSARDKVFGRATVGEIAARAGAAIAVNAGFFEIGGNEDGRPDGTLVIDGMIYGLMMPKHACLIKKDGRLSIDLIEPKLTIEIGKRKISPSKFNRFIDTKEIYLYTSSWGRSSLSPFKNRKEIVIDSNYKISSIANHGNNIIPEGGYVISLPTDRDIDGLSIGNTAKFTWNPSYLGLKGTAAVLGIPALILEGVIQNDLGNRDKHARTAFGIKKNGDLVIVIVEHEYNRSLKSITLEDINKIINDKQITSENLTVRNLKQIITNNLATNNGIIGLTLEELANFMLEIGCRSAINLDGGGSSALYIEGKYINRITGDEDEAFGLKVARPVSNAIVFTKRSQNTEK